MGFLDDLGSTLNRGAEATARTAQSLKLKAQLADLKSQRSNVCSRLGAAVYDRLKDDSNFTEGLEDIFDGIANCDQRIEALQAELDKIEAEAAARAKSQWMDVCPCCGYRVNHGDSFCCRCGTKIPKKPVNEGQPVQEEPDVVEAEYSPIDVEPIVEVTAEPVQESTN